MRPDHSYQHAQHLHIVTNQGAKASLATPSNRKERRIAEKLKRKEEAEARKAAR